MTSKFVISIGRQYGAGGRSIGPKLASRLGVNYYDKELIPLAAKEIGFDVRIFEQVDEKTRFSRFLHSIEGMLHSFGENYMSSEMLFKVQSDVIKKIAERESCVIVGRCSDYVLRNHENMISIFFTATMEDRICRVASRLSISEDEAIERINHEDRNRASYYNCFTGKEWGRAESYTFCINTSFFESEEQVVDAILKLIK